MDPNATKALRKPQEPGMCNVPPTLEMLNVAVHDGNVMQLNQILKRAEARFGQVSP